MSNQKMKALYYINQGVFNTVAYVFSTGATGALAPVILGKSITVTTL